MSFIDSIGAIEFFGLCIAGLTGFVAGFLTMYIGSLIINAMIDRRFENGSIYEGLYTETEEVE